MQNSFMISRRYRYWLNWPKRPRNRTNKQVSLCSFLNVNCVSECKICSFYDLCQLWQTINAFFKYKQKKNKPWTYKAPDVFLPPIRRWCVRCAVLQHLSLRILLPLMLLFLFMLLFFLFSLV